MTTKTFDAVSMMRGLRDALNQEMETMTPEERLQFIRQRALSTDTGRSLMGREPASVSNENKENPAASLPGD